MHRPIFSIRGITNTCATFLVALQILTGAPQASAQTNAQSFAATMQSWRDACGDPNPDLARGYLTEAMSTGNADIRQACLRQIAASDNADLNSAALRVIIPSLPFVRFQVGKPDGYHNIHLLSAIKSGLFFQMADPSPAAGTALWMSQVQGSPPDANMSGTVRVLGNGIVWSGVVAQRNGIPCDITANLESGKLELKGMLNCPGHGEFPVSANLLE